MDELLVQTQKVHVKIEENYDGRGAITDSEIMFLGVSPGTAGEKGNTCTVGGKDNECTDGGKGNECIVHLVEKTMNVLFLLSQTPHVKTDETCDGNVVGLCNVRSCIHSSITDFEIMFPRLCAHDTQIF